MSFLGDQRWLFFVLPGFIALFVASFVSDFPEIRDSQLPIIYVALTVCSVALPLVVVDLFGRITGEPFTFGGLLQSRKFIAAVFFCSVATGLLFGVAHTTNYVSDSLRALFGKDVIIKSSISELRQQILQLSSSTQKFAEFDRQPYVDPDTDKKWAQRYAVLHFSENLKSYEGYIAKYSATNEKPAVYLSPACYFSPEGEVIVVKGPGVWVDAEMATSIEILYETCSRCKLRIDEIFKKKSDRKCPIESGEQ